MSGVVTRNSSGPHAQREPILRHRWTTQDFHRLARAGVLDQDSRVELVEGEVVDMAPIGSGHANAVDELLRALYRRLGERFRIRVQNPIHLDAHNEPQPDLVVALDRDYSAAHPVAANIVLVVEVADTSLAYDRDIKLPLYARCGIPQAWIVDVDTRCLTVYREPSAEGYRRVATLETDEAVEVCGVSLPGMELLAKGQCLTR